MNEKCLKDYGDQDPRQFFDIIYQLVNRRYSFKKSSIIPLLSWQNCKLVTLE